MASLVVTFTEGTATGALRQNQPNFPKFVGNAARTEKVIIDAATRAGNLVALATDSFVVLKAGAECFVNVGLVPVAVNGEGWHLSVDQQLELFVAEGESVACLLGTGVSGLTNLILLASETDTTFVIIEPEIVQVGLASETDIAFTVIENPVRQLIGLPFETDSGFVVVPQGGA